MKAFLALQTAGSVMAALLHKELIESGLGFAVTFAAIWLVAIVLWGCWALATRIASLKRSN